MYSKTTSKTKNKDVQNDEKNTILENNSVIYNIKKTFTIKSFITKQNELGSRDRKHRPKY